MSARRKAEYHKATLALPIGVERLWAAMRSLNAERVGLGHFTVQDVAHRAKTEPDHVRPYVRGLRAAGYLILSHNRVEAGRTTPVYQLVKPSREAPRVRPDGRHLPELGRELLWRTMKLLRTFSVAELHAHADDRTGVVKMKASATKRYVLELARVGVLQATGESPARYRLVRSLGAAAPRVLRGHIVFDPNANAVVGDVDAKEVQ